MGKAITVRQETWIWIIVAIFWGALVLYVNKTILYPYTIAELWFVSIAAFVRILYLRGRSYFTSEQNVFVKKSMYIAIVGFVVAFFTTGKVFDDNILAIAWWIYVILSLVKICEFRFGRKVWNIFGATSIGLILLFNVLVMRANQGFGAFGAGIVSMIAIIGIGLAMVFGPSRNTKK